MTDGRAVTPVRVRERQTNALIPGAFAMGRATCHLRPAATARSAGRQLHLPQLMRHGASSVREPASDEVRLVVVARILPAVTVPPALPNCGYILDAGDGLPRLWPVSVIQAADGWACLAIAQTKPASSRATAAATTFAGLPALASSR